MKRRTLGIIPARFASTRFPGKPLALIQGQPMIWWVYHSAKKCSALDKVIVATDDERIAQTVEDFGGEALLTSAHHPSGFDRIGEVSDRFSDFTHYVNIQGDEPLIASDTITAALNLFENPACDISTSAVAFQNDADFQNENMVKVVLAADQRALYFSRSPIPFYRNTELKSTLAPLKHQGLYCYSARALHKLRALPQADLEKAESLEQLRFLFHGFGIFVAIAKQDSPGVDTPEDILRVEKLLKKIAI